MQTFHRAKANNKEGYQFIYTGDIVKTVYGNFKMLEERTKQGEHLAENQETGEIVKFSETLSLFTEYEIIQKG